jgi:hypothetical protein
MRLGSPIINASHPQSMTMTTFDLIWQITWRSALRILALGALFGGIYSASVLTVLLFVDGPEQGLALFNVMLLAVVLGAVIGAVVGFIVGMLIGLLISMITIVGFRPLRDTARYLQVVQWSSVLVGGIGTLVGAPLMLRLIFGQMDLSEGIGVLAIFSLVPALLAGLAIRHGSRQVAKWYILVAS